MLTDWMTRAVCRDHDPELWFPVAEESGGDVATGHCRTCPVRVECLEYALDIGAVGIWGGTTTAQRRQIRAQRATSPPQPVVTTRRQPDGDPWTKWQDQRLLDLLDDGADADEAARRLGRSIDDVYRRARELRRRREVTSC